ncbi:MAG: aliphatic sulfonate ABC transporter substrate-binding protein [Canibacter sp.]
MSRLTRSLSLTAIAALTLGLAACSGTGGGDEGSSDSQSVRMGTQPWLGYGQWYVAEDQDIFTERDLDVSLESFNTDSDVNAALASGKLDMASVASHTALQFVENGVDVSIVLLLDAATTADAIVTDGSITDVADLKGKQIAYEEGATSELLLGDALESVGLTFDDISAVPMGADEAGTALISGNVPAAVTYEPYVSAALKADDSIETLATAADHEGLISDVLVVRNDVLEENPELVKNVVGAWTDALDYYESNPEDAQAMIAEGVGASVEELESAFDGVHFYTLDENKELLTGDYQTDILPSISAVAQRIGMIQEEVDPAGVIDDSYLP